MSQAHHVMVTMMTHCGAVRTNNEDAIVVGAATVAGPSMPDPVTIQLPVGTSAVVAIADGIGGHVAGEISSAFAVQRLADRNGELTGPTEITDLLDRINNQLYDLAKRRREYLGTGTTIVGLLFNGPDTYWFNVGDSRVYREDDGYLGQLSVDDTASLTGEPGERHSGGTVITQALGGGAAYTAIEPHIALDPVAGPARWLLCSDGLSDMVSIEKIEEILATATDDNDAVKSLWTAAMNAGGWDNITIALVGRTEAAE